MITFLHSPSWGRALVVTYPTKAADHTRISLWATNGVIDDYDMTVGALKSQMWPHVTYAQALRVMRLIAAPSVVENFESRYGILELVVGADRGV